MISLGQGVHAGRDSDRPVVHVLDLVVLLDEFMLVLNAHAASIIEIALEPLLGWWHCHLFFYRNMVIRVRVLDDSIVFDDLVRIMVASHAFV